MLRALLGSVHLVRAWQWGTRWPILCCKLNFSAACRQSAPLTALPFPDEGFGCELPPLAGSGELDLVQFVLEVFVIAP